MDSGHSGISSVEVKNYLQHTKPEGNINKTDILFVQFTSSPNKNDRKKLARINQSYVNYDCKLSGQ